MSDPTWDEIDSAIMRHRLDVLSTADLGALVVRLERERDEAERRGKLRAAEICREVMRLGGPFQAQNCAAAILTRLTKED